MNEFTYQLNQTLNNKVNLDRLTNEINQSSITIALDNIRTVNTDIVIKFKANISSQEEVTLDSLVFAHTGEPLVPPSTFKTNSFGEIVMSPSTPYGVKKTYVTHNLCDKTTWYQNSVINEDVVMVDSGNHILYTLPTPEIIIDVVHWKIADESTDPAIFSKKAIVKVNNVAYTENYYKGVTKISPSTGYDIDYTTGAVTFNNALSENDVVTITYYGLPETDENDQYGTRQSAFTLAAPEGKKVVLKMAEVQWSKDVRMTDAIRFIPYYITGKDPELDYVLQSLNINLPNGYHLPLTMLDPNLEKRFNNMAELVDDSDGAYEIPATGESGRTIKDLPYAMQIFIFNYQGTNNMVLDDVTGKYIKIWLKDDVVLTGSRATATLYGTIV